MSKAHRKPENCGAKSCKSMISVHRGACCCERSEQLRSIPRSAERNQCVIIKFPVLVVRAGTTPRTLIKQSLYEIQQSGCKLLGTVLNRADVKGRAYGKYGYGKYGYGYG